MPVSLRSPALLSLPISCLAHWRLWDSQKHHTRLNFSLVPTVSLVSHMAPSLIISFSGFLLTAVPQFRAFLCTLTQIPPHPENLCTKFTNKYSDARISLLQHGSASQSIFLPPSQACCPSRTEFIRLPHFYHFGWFFSLCVSFMSLARFFVCLFVLYLFICVAVNMDQGTPVVARGQMLVLVLSFHHMDPQDQTQFICPGGECLYPSS